MPDLHDPYVLVVDDNRLNRELAKALLSCLGFASVEAVDGLDALDRYAHCEPVAVLMDFSMPQLNGLEALKAIRRLETRMGRPRVPVLLLTAAEFGRDPDDWRQAGGDGVMSKPLRFEDLRTALEQLKLRKAVETKPRTDKAMWRSH